MGINRGDDVKEYNGTMEVSATKKMITNSNVVVHSNDIESVKIINDLRNEINK